MPKYRIKVNITFTDKETGEDVRAGTLFKTTDYDRARDIMRRNLGKFAGVEHPKRSSKAEKVDLSCVTEPGKNPLKECKQSKEYALECGPQYVKLPKEKCEIKEAK